MNRLRYFIGNKIIAVISNLVFVIYISTFVSCNHEKPSDENLKLGLLSLISTDSNIEAYDWNLPTGFPVPVVPNSNPMSQAKVELGRFLFYDTKLFKQINISLLLIFLIIKSLGNQNKEVRSVICIASIPSTINP